MRTHPATRACHSASFMYSLAMPSKARSKSCLTAAEAHASGQGSAGFAVALFMNESSAAGAIAGKRTVGIHWSALETFRGLTRAREDMVSITASRRRVFFNTQRGSIMNAGTNRDCGGVALVRSPHRMTPEVARQVTDVGAMRFAAQLSGRDDYEIADEIDVSRGYMSKVLKGTAGLYGKRLVRFMRITNNIAPLQWLGEQMGCDVIERHSMAAQLAAAQAHVESLKQRLGS